MKLKNIIYTAVLAAGLCIGTNSCSDYLDISSELSADLSIEEIFETPKYTRQWHANIFNCISEYSEMGSEMNAFRNPWANLCGEVTSEGASSKNVMTAGYTAANAGYHRWATLYQYIRQAMIFLERGKAIGSGTEIITEAEMAQMKDEARFFLAYSYFSLFELYGPVPIVTVIDDASYPTVNDYMRPSVDEMVEHIDKILNDLISPESNLPESVVTSVDADGRANGYNLNDIVRPTKITAMALRAKLWVYASSKLFNGGFGQDLADKDGKKLFPAEDKNKWKKAATYLENLITAAETAGHRLYEKYDNAGNLDVNQTLYLLFQNYTEEILWCTSNNDWSNNTKMEKRTTPRDIASSYGNIGPSQESVDMFFTKEGLNINDPGTNYDETGFADVANPDNNNKTDRVFSMYADREPRFYRDVLYQGRSWFANYMAINPNYRLDFSKDGGAGPAGNNSKCGYMISKFKNVSITFQGSNNSNIGRPSILFRLADFYLYYAEALNEINPRDPKIISYIDKVRERAGIPGYQALKDAGKKDIIGDYTKQQKAIQNERFVELFCEGQRYFDIRRWMICGKGQDADQTQFHGMDQYGDPTVAIGQQGSFYRRTQLEKRLWDDKMYLYPVPQNTVNLSEGLIVQNPGW